MKHIHAVVFILIASLGTAASAHHSLSAAYRLDERLGLQGTVLKVAFRDPHVYVQLEARDARGVAHRWSLEWSDTQTLSEVGVTSGTLRLGDELEVTGHPSRNTDARQLLLVGMTRPADGWTWEDKTEPESE